MRKKEPSVLEEWSNVRCVCRQKLEHCVRIRRKAVDSVVAKNLLTVRLVEGLAAPW